MSETKRKPQKRVLETKKRLMEAAISMYATKGYYHTTVDEIASAAGLSTGIAYKYYGNKKELLLAALEYGFEHIKEASNTTDDILTGFSTIEGSVNYALTRFEEIHIQYRDLHEELEGLRHTDEDVRKLYDGVLLTALKELTIFLKGVGISGEHLREKIILSIGIMEEYCHNYMSGLYTAAETSYMKAKTAEIVSNILKDR